MIDPSAFVRTLKETGVNSFSGVPCSYLKSLITVLSADDNYIAAASEGEAIGIGTGSYLAGSVPSVLIQSSGLGNCVNPLTSLVAPFQIPMLLIVGYRNADGKGPPQHVMMGEITEPLLDLMGIQHATLAPDLETAESQIKTLLEHSRAENRAVALLIRDKTFEPAPHQEDLPTKIRYECQDLSVSSESSQPSSRVEVLKAIGESVSESDVLIATTGMTSRELFTIGDRPGNFYMVGSMGCALGIGLGIAQQIQDRRIIIIDGDGALLMKLGALATVGHYHPDNLIHIVLDNGTYESTGSQPTTATTTSFTDIAKATGYANVMSAKSPQEIQDALTQLGRDRGPSFLHLPIADGHLDGVGRVPSDLPALARRLMTILKAPHVYSAVG